jgi:hypothetical protein
MIDLILKTNGLDVNVRCTVSEGYQVNTAGKTLELITKLIGEMWDYEDVNITIKTSKEQEDSNPQVPHVPDELFKVHEDNMMRVYNEQRTIS